MSSGSYWPIPVLHICGLLTSVAVLLAFVWDILRRTPLEPVLVYCLLTALVLWLCGSVGVDAWLFFLQLLRWPLPNVLTVLGWSDGSIFLAARWSGYLLMFVPLAVATRYRDDEEWPSRFGMLAGLSLLAWMLGHVLDGYGPRYIPQDFMELLGASAGQLTWEILRGTALTGFGWAALGFWSVWYVGVFREQTPSQTAVKAEELTPITH